MLSLFPPSETKIENLAESLHAEQRNHNVARPWVMSSMAYSLNGSVAVGGKSEGLSSDKDREMLKIFRSISDVILVGAETVRAERYGAPKLSTALQRLRVNQGKTAVPALAIVSQSLRFDDSLPLFTNNSYRPLVITSEAAQASQKVAEKTEIIRLGKTSVDFPLLMGFFAEKKFAVVLSEGGPAVTQQLIKNDLIDEWNMTLAPTLVDVAPTKQRNTTPCLQNMNLDRIWQHESFLFGRWVRLKKQS